MQGERMSKDEFKEAMEDLADNFYTCYGLIRWLNDDTVYVATGGWSDNEDAVYEFNIYSHHKYLACMFPGGGFIYSRDAKKDEDRIFKLLEEKGEE